jgi:hypothetical protein
LIWALKLLSHDVQIYKRIHFSVCVAHANEPHRHKQFVLQKLAAHTDETQRPRTGKTNTRLLPPPPFSLSRFADEKTHRSSLEAILPAPLRVGARGKLICICSRNKRAVISGADDALVTIFCTACFSALLSFRKNPI